MDATFSRATDGAGGGGGHDEELELDTRGVACCVINISDCLLLFWSPGRAIWPKRALHGQLRNAQVRPRKVRCPWE